MTLKTMVKLEVVNLLPVSGEWYANHGIEEVLVDPKVIAVIHPLEEITVVDCPDSNDRHLNTMKVASVYTTNIRGLNISSRGNCKFITEKCYERLISMIAAI